MSKLHQLFPLLLRTTMMTMDIPSPLRAMEVPVCIHENITQDVVSLYKRTLPILEGNVHTNITTQILDFIQHLGGGHMNEVAFEESLKKINFFMASGSPIDLCILGFPCKSGNVDLKVINGEFDLSDYLGLVTLQHLAENIAKIYPPGAKIMIINKEPYLGEISNLLEREIGLNNFCQFAPYENRLAKLLSDFPSLSLGEDLTEDYVKALDAQEISQIIPENQETYEEQLNFFKREFNCSAIKEKLEIDPELRQAVEEKVRLEVTKIILEANESYKEKSKAFDLGAEELEAKVRLEVTKNILKTNERNKAKGKAVDLSPEELEEKNSIGSHKNNSGGQ